MAERARKTRTSGYWPQRSAWRHSEWFCLMTGAGQNSEQSKTDLASRLLFPPGPKATPEPNLQPPAAPAATEVASVHLARWAPHPSAETAPGTEPSPRTPALVTMPPRQKLVDEAASVKAFAPAAVPSSLPVAEFYRRRAAAPREEAWPVVQVTICTGVTWQDGKGRKNQSRPADPPPRGGSTGATPCRWRGRLG